MEAVSFQLTCKFIGFMSSILFCGSISELWRKTDYYLYYLTMTLQCAHQQIWKCGAIDVKK